MTLFSHKIQQRVAEYIAANDLLPSVQRDAESHPFVIVGLSGGPDSVALLHILHSLGYSCYALHCNFHLRGTESDRDQAFCEQLCAFLQLPIAVAQFDTHAYMKRRHLSLEMAARELRYNWWKEWIDNIQESLNYKQSESTDVRIAIGHHADDSIETMLMNLMRGTGINGMTGIVPYNAQTHVIRPLLSLSRQDILKYLEDNDLSYVIDSTNAENDTLRNQIRNQLLPMMESMVPQCRQGFMQTMEHLEASRCFADLYLNQFADLTVQHQQWGLTWHELSIDKLKKELPTHADSYLHAWQSQYASETMKVIQTPHLAYTTPVDEALIQKHCPKMLVEHWGKRHPLPSNYLHEDFDDKTVTLPLKLRPWQEGDRIDPLGMKGHTKLVSDLFQNAHYSPMQKATTWVVQDATGAILWVIGLRMSESHKITAETERILRISVQ